MRRRVRVGTKETKVLGMGSDRSFNFFFLPPSRALGANYLNIVCFRR